MMSETVELRVHKLARMFFIQRERTNERLARVLTYFGDRSVRPANFGRITGAPPPAVFGGKSWVVSSPLWRIERNLGDPYVIAQWRVLERPPTATWTREWLDDLRTRSNTYRIAQLTLV
jgi:hypothetical protein